MKLSAPVYRLKRNARLLSREKNIPLHDALDRIALQEGFGSWSLLAAKVVADSPASKLFARLIPGDLLLLGARPGQGKTLLGLELAVEAIKAGGRSIFFTLEFTRRDVEACFRALGTDWARLGGMFVLDDSNAIDDGHIIAALASAPRGTVAVIDYLQLLDRKRQSADLTAQVRALKSFAAEQGLMLVFLSQIDRAYDPSRRPFPEMQDVRLSNPLDLTLFDKACFLNNSEIRFQALH